MYLPALARDLYKSQKEVEAIEQQLLAATTFPKQEALKNQLRQAHAELEQIRKIMEGRKEHSRSSLHKQKLFFG